MIVAWGMDGLGRTCTDSTMPRIISTSSLLAVRTGMMTWKARGATSPGCAVARAWERKLCVKTLAYQHIFDVTFAK
jgi:hypothetical protein